MHDEISHCSHIPNPPGGSFTYVDVTETETAHTVLNCPTAHCAPLRLHAAPTADSHGVLTWRIPGPRSCGYRQQGPDEARCEGVGQGNLQLLMSLAACLHALRMSGIRRPANEQVAPARLWRSHLVFDNLVTSRLATGT